jgi:nuclear receptor-binding protein
MIRNHLSLSPNKDVGGASETTTNSGSNKHQAQTDDDEEEDEPVYIESSPCSRWQKRRETVAQRDIPGIDTSYLAMDTEEGVEVVWNEVLFSERKINDIQHNKISEVFDKLIELNHMNIVKFHGYWQDRTKNDDRSRVVFITEYMSSGSLKHCLRKTKKTKQSLSKNSWRRWCIQLLSALNYLHSCEEPIIHGNLTCDTIFIQNTGLLKIGSIHYPQLKVFADLGIVAPDVLHRHVRSISDSTARNLHFQAPEIDTDLNNITTAVDIYSLGMVTLEMINLDLGGNGDMHLVTDDVVNEAIQALENPAQKDLVLKCLESNPLKRPTARELLFHSALFEIPSLKLLSVHSLADDIRLKPDRSFVSPIIHPISNDQVFAELESNVKPVIYTYKDCPSFDLDKLLEDVQNGLYPITAYHLLFPTQSSLTVPTRSTISDKNLTSSTSSLSSLTSTENDLTTPVQTITDSSIFHSNNINDTNMSNGMKSRANTTSSITHHEKSGSFVNDLEYHRRDSISTSTGNNHINHHPTITTLTNTDEKEIRRIIDIQCKIKTKETGLCMLFISVKFQDRLQRDMTAEIEPDETPNSIAKELLEHGLIHESDYTRVEQSIDRALNATITSPDVLNSTSTSLLDVKKTAVVAATAALITAQALQNQMHNPSTNGTIIDGNNPSTWTTTPSQPVMLLPP